MSDNANTQNQNDANVPDDGTQPEQDPSQDIPQGDLKGKGSSQAQRQGRTGKPDSDE